MAIKPMSILRILWAAALRKTLFFLKCDKKGCTYVSYYEYPEMGHINMPCPLCNSNLCTEEDMKLWLQENDIKIEEV